MRVSRGIWVVVLTALALPAPAAAAGEWFGRETFATTLDQNGMMPIPGVSGDGTVFLAYRDGRGLNPPGRVALRARTPDGTFSPDAQLVQPDPGMTGNQFPIGLVASRGDSAIVLWRDNNPPGGLFARRMTADGVLGPILPLTEPGSANTTSPTLAGDGAGNAVAVWRDDATARLRLRRIGAGGALGPGQFITDPGEMAAEHAQAVAPDGTVAVTYLAGPLDGKGLYLRTISPGGVVGAREPVAPGAPQLATLGLGRDAAGGIQVSWWDVQRNLVFLRARSAGGAWDVARSLGVPGVKSSKPLLGVADDGSSAIVWQEEEATPPRIVGRRRAPDGTFGPVLAIAGPVTGVSFGEPQLSMDRGGTAVVAWQEATATTREHFARGFRADSALDPPQSVSVTVSLLPTEPFGIGGDGLGNTAVAALDPATHTFDVTTGDFGGPEQRALIAPARVERGEPARYSFTPVDLFGTVAAARWEFPGRSVENSAAFNTFPLAGRFAVRSVTRDATGNTRAVTHPVEVVDTRRPVVRSLRLQRARFRRGKAVARVAARKRRARIGTTLRYELSEDASVAIRVERRAIGRRRGKRCVKATRRNRRGKRCVRFVRTSLATVTRRQAAGRHAVKFRGKVGRRRLALGRHRFVLVATDPSGNRSRPARRSFRVVR